MTCRILSFFAAILVAVSAFGQDCVAPCAPAAPTCAPAPTCAAAPTCAPICVPCINPLALVKDAACTAINEVGCCAANLKARLCALKPCVSFAPCCAPAPCAPAACAPAAPTCDPAPAACAPAAPTCDPAPAACAPAAPTCDPAPAACAPVCAPAIPCCKVSCTIKPFQRLKAAFARPCVAAPACVAPCAPACEAPAPACAPVAPCEPVTGC